MPRPNCFYEGGGGCEEVRGEGMREREGGKVLNSHSDSLYQGI